ncbi:MAG: hypothetical protein ABI700_19720 [Chloroflexota bacterium]
MLKYRAFLLDVLVILLPCLIFAAHATRWGTWIVDDAGISFAYSRNLAQGYGLVSQAGKAPVEGYSNFTWVLLLAPFFLPGNLDPALAPKILSFLLIVGTFVVLYRVLKPLPSRRWIGLATFSLIALNTSFAAWTMSGLENPLYVFLVSLLLAGSMRIVADGEVARRVLAGADCGTHWDDTP